jgi:NAD(P)-dependent dehydrogenase (short-subunit alcohol dehydrogenase family)
MISPWTAADIPDQADRTAIVTGANSGIGFEMARALAGKQATVVLACRSRERGEAALQRILQEHPAAKSGVILLDLADLASVRRFADEFAGRHARLDLLINNAGIMVPPFARTTDGFESQFGTNHLGHFALTGLLLDIIIHTPRSRIVTISSTGHRFGKIDFDNLNAEKGYDRGQAYGQSKLANLLFTYELQRRFAAAGIDALAAAAHPGWTATNLPVHWPAVRFLTPLIGQAPEMGALPALHAATVPDVHGGDYFGPGGWLEVGGYPVKVQSSAASHDPAVAARLWAVSEELTGVHYHWPDEK